MLAWTIYGKVLNLSPILFSKPCQTGTLPASLMVYLFVSFSITEKNKKRILINTELYGSMVDFVWTDKYQLVHDVLLCYDMPHQCHLIITSA